MAAKKIVKELTQAEKDTLARLAKVHEELKTIRKRDDLTIKPCPYLKESLKLRYYQIQGLYHLLMMKRFLLGDSTGTGKTIIILAALAYLWPKETDNKVVIITPKSALLQWAGEIQKFTKGVRPIVARGTAEERKKAYLDFLNAPTGPDAEKVVLLINYSILVRDWDVGANRPLLPNGKPDLKASVSPGLLDEITSKIKQLCVVFDESHAFKNTSTKTWQTCRFLADKAHRCYGMTATLLKNRLEEGFSIYKVIVPDLFRNKTSFMDDYCVVRLQSVGGGRKIPMVVGYRNLEQFRARIDPFYLGRQKHEISSELPKLVTKEIVCELSAAEDKKYAEALTGILELGDGEVKDYEQNKTLTALIYCQQVVNSLSLLKFKGGDELGNEHYEDIVSVKEQSSKETALLDLLTEELDDEKVIVYTRFASLVPRLQDLLKKQKVKSVAITGKVKDTDRRKAQEAFQDLESDTKVVIITDAGAESINLQAASAIVFFDAPWSWGNYVQLLGRPIRIGSIHTTVLAYHLIAERPAQRAKDRKTIDQHTLDTLRSKKDLVDKILGEAAQGALDFSSKDDGPLAVLRAMQAGAIANVLDPVVGTATGKTSMKSDKKEPTAKPKRMAEDLDDLDAILSSAAAGDKT